VIVTLNIGLMPNMGTSSPDELQWLAVGWLMDNFKSAYFERRDGLHQEPTLVVAMKDPQRHVREIEDRVYSLCWIARQDCIALEYSFEGVKSIIEKLVGPKAAVWGPFNRDKFLRPSVRIT
jgi:hypothetical protein